MKLIWPKIDQGRQENLWWWQNFDTALKADDDSFSRNFTISHGDLILDITTDSL